MGITDTRAALHALTRLEVDPELPDRMRADGVDDVTICAVSHAVELADAALAALAAAAEAQAHADAAAGAVDPDDASTATAAAVAQASADAAAEQAQALATDAAGAAVAALAGLERRHGPMEAAVAGAGGSTRVAQTGWYDR